MDKKTAVVLKKFKPYSYVWQRLKYCESCGSYTALEDESCTCCGKKDKLMSISRQMELNTVRRFHIEQLILLAIILVAFIAVRNFTQIAATLLGGIALLLALRALQRHYKESEINRNISKLAVNGRKLIKKGLENDVKACNVNITEKNYKNAYEKLREIGVFLQNDFLRIKKLECLDHFLLRKDMEFELDTLIVGHYNQSLINYISEVAKLDKSLVNRKVMDYILINEPMILEQENGIETLSNVAGAVIRSKANVILYRDFILRYLDELSKERLQRLCRVLQSSYSEELGELYESTLSLVNKTYKNDNDFTWFLA